VAEPSSNARWREFAWTVALVAAVAVILWLAYLSVHDLTLRAAQGDPVAEVLADDRRLVLFAALLVLATALTLAFLLWRVGQATFTQERFPPTGLPKLLDAQPRKGVAAAYLGLRLRRAAVVAAVSGVGLAVAAAWFALRL
jgi:hypothetical protein